MMYKPNKYETGFTIVEILIALLLLGLILVAVAIPLLGFNRINATSQKTLSETTAAQKDLEGARTYVIANYNNPALLTTILLSGVVCENISALDAVMSPAACTSLASPPMRRLTVTKSVDGASAPVTLSLDVRP